MSSAAKRSSAVGAADQFDMDQSAEVELQKLQRQVRQPRDDAYVHILLVWSGGWWCMLAQHAELPTYPVDGVMTKCQQECVEAADLFNQPADVIIVPGETVTGSR